MKTKRCKTCNSKLIIIEKCIPRKNKPATHKDIPYCNKCKKEIKG